MESWAADFWVQNGIGTPGSHRAPRPTAPQDPRPWAALAAAEAACGVAPALQRAAAEQRLMCPEARARGFGGRGVVQGVGSAEGWGGLGG